MNEVDEVGMHGRDAQFAQALALDGRMAGEMLRKMREDADVSAEVVASAMKVPLPKLLALENGDFHELPDLTFARGLASAICRGFGVDPEPVLAQMPAVMPELRPPEHPAQQPLGSSSDRPPPIVSSLPVPVLIAAAALLLAAAALWLLPTLPIQLGAPQESAESAAPAPVPNDTAQAERQAAAAPPVTVISEPGPAADAPEESVPADAVAAAGPAVALAPAAAASEPAATPSSDILGFAATAETWVSVRDAQDKMLLNRTLSAGDTLSVDGKLPLFVTIGRKSAVAVTVRGKPRKLRGSSEVARFMVE